jgi:hypothetical protein
MLTVYHKWTSFPNNFLDLSKLSSDRLVEEAEALMGHHKSCSIYLGYLEPGWMLDPKHEIRLRNLIRKFDVHLICWFLESLPFSWKNEIGTIYRPESQQNGHTQIIDNGSSYQHKPKAKHNPFIREVTNQ